MKPIKDHEFSDKTMVYVIVGNEVTAISFGYYKDHREKYEGMIVILANENVPVYFRQG